MYLGFDNRQLTPLGDPAPNAPKWFAAVEMIRLRWTKTGCTRPPEKLRNTGERSVNGVILGSITIANAISDKTRRFKLREADEKKSYKHELVLP